jgi:hypothetical protein
MPLSMKVLVLLTGFCAYSKTLIPFIYVTLNQLDFFNEIFKLPCLVQSMIIYGDIKVGLEYKPDQTSWMCRLAWLYTGGIG